MAAEAQRLIGVSLSKLTQPRGRGGCSLHRSLLVATVLQKARYIFMEDAYRLARENFAVAKKKEEAQVMPNSGNRLHAETRDSDATNPPEELPAASDKESNDRLVMDCDSLDSALPQGEEDLASRATKRLCEEDISDSVNKRLCIDPSTSLQITITVSPALPMAVDSVASLGPSLLESSTTLDSAPSPSRIPTSSEWTSCELPSSSDSRTSSAEFLTCQLDLRSPSPPLLSPATCGDRLQLACSSARLLLPVL